MKPNESPKNTFMLYFIRVECDKLSKNKIKEFIKIGPVRTPMKHMNVVNTSMLGVKGVTERKIISKTYRNVIKCLWANR